MDTAHTAAPPGAAIKHSYTIPCASAFRDAIEALAAKRRVNVGDVARSVLLVIPAAVIAEFPDPGEPAPDDRETVILKSGPAQGRPWRRKPRLQVRMAPGYQVEFIRRALALALAMDGGRYVLKLEDPSKPPPRPEPPPPQPQPETALAVQAANEEVERLRAIVSVLAFDPLPQGVNSRDEALHVLGFPPGAHPDKRTIRARFRMLATIHHPDSQCGSHHRMSQLNQAMEFLRD
ncbi:MAG TPA: J domain-containing protein [Magnetospirillum sp.]|jgi:hypothetical protein|nr:J domain-containing protein [Magnetospirillum sp.]